MKIYIEFNCDTENTPLKLKMKFQVEVLSCVRSNVVS